MPIQCSSPINNWKPSLSTANFIQHHTHWQFIIFITLKILWTPDHTTFTKVGFCIISLFSLVRIIQNIRKIKTLHILKIAWHKFENLRWGSLHREICFCSNYICVKSETKICLLPVSYTLGCHVPCTAHCHVIDLWW